MPTKLEFLFPEMEMLAERQSVININDAESLILVYGTLIDLTS